MTYNKFKLGLTKAFVYGLVSVFALAGTMSGQNITRVEAATSNRYVAITGSDLLNDCTDQANPCVTIQHAIDQATAGDTINVAAGTYVESVSVDKQLIINGANAGVSAGSQPQVRNNESIISGGFILETTGEGTIVNGFTIENGTSFAPNYDAIAVNPTTVGFTIENNIIKNVLFNTQSNGIETVAGANNLVIRNNEITNNNRGIYLNPADGIQIIGNYIHDNSLATPGVGIASDGQSNLTITGNTISNQSEGFGISNAGTNVVINNNNLTNISTDAVGWYSGQGINAASNWWGSQANPSSQIIGSSHVTYSPWCMNSDCTSLSNQGPVVSIIQPKSGDYVNKVVTVSGAVVDADPQNSVFTVVDSSGFTQSHGFYSGETNPSFSLDTSILADGDATINFQATDAMGNPSNIASVSIYVDNSAPAAPANFTATPGNGNVVLNWDNVADATSYQVRYRAVTAGNNADYTYITLAGSINSADIKGLTNGTTYEFGVQALDRSGNASVYSVNNATPSQPVITVASTSVTSTPVTNHQFSDLSSQSTTQSTVTNSNKDLNQASDSNGKIKGKETSKDNSTSRSVITFIILLLALAAGIGGYYLYEWWLAKQDSKGVVADRKFVDKRKPKTPVTSKVNKTKSTANTKRPTNRRKNGRW